MGFFFNQISADMFLGFICIYEIFQCIQCQNIRCTNKVIKIQLIYIYTIAEKKKKMLI